jgi:tetratricopeptide (TPR) repeat protein
VSGGVGRPSSAGAGRDVRRQPDAAFLDRVEEYRHLERHLEALAGDPRHLVVVGMAGLGGIGKTRFLDEVASRFSRLPQPPTVVSVALGGSAFSSLLSIREQVGVPCHLFDVAAVVYAAVSGQPWPQIGLLKVTAGFPDEEPPAQDAVADTLPVTYAVDRFGGLAPDLVLRRGYDRSAFAAVDALRAEPDELHSRLPSLLAADLARVLADPEHRRLVFLYDAYEVTSDPELTSGVGWLPPFVRSLGAGIHVIASRRSLEGDAAVWGTQVRQRTLDELPEDECRRMIRREIGDHLRRRVEDRIVAASRCVPFNLHASIAVCRAHLRERGTVDVEELPSSSPAMVERLLHHLSETERRLTISLAAVQYFDEPLYQSLVRSLDRTDAAVRVGAFVEWFFVVEVEQTLFRTHHLLTDFVRRGAELMDDARSALQSATEHLALRTTDWRAPDQDRLTRLFSAVLEGCQAVDDVPTTVVERLVDIGYDLYDAGYWRELAVLPVVEGAACDAARLVAQFFVALSIRRVHGSVEALARLEPLAARRALLGRHATSFDLEDAYLREIRGDYASARRRFRQLDEAVTQFDGTRRDHVRTRLYHADMLTMDGRLQEASRLLLEAYEMLPAERTLDWTELVRHRGHALRFGLDHVGAQQEYLRALDRVREVPSLRGKLRTNLAEARCWVEPALAAQDAEEAIALNDRLGSRIEVAKAHAALGVALSGTRRFEDARAACERALVGALEAGYPAGACFARQARVVTEVRAGELAVAAEVYADLVAAVTTLGTYGHLCVVPAWFLGADDEVRRWSHDVDWTGSDDLRERLRSLSR